MLLQIGESENPSDAHRLIAYETMLFSHMLQSEEVIKTLSEGQFSTINTVRISTSISFPTGNLGYKVECQIKPC